LNARPLVLNRFLKTRQQRIGVFTRDQRRLDNAIIRLDTLEEFLRGLLQKPCHIDEYTLEN
jgi:hypothetical protein